jgi:hypothetical protein
MRPTTTLTLLLVVAGCGDGLVGGTYKPPYFSITAKINSALSDPQFAKLPDNTQVAILWWTSFNSGSAYAQQLVHSSLDRRLAAVRLDVTDLPKGAAVLPVSPELRGFGVDPRMHWSSGTLVVYVDNNKNGKLDIDPYDGKNSFDRVLAANPDVYVDDLLAGSPAPSIFTGIVPTRPGFSLVQEPPQANPPLGTCDFIDDRDQHETLQCAAVRNGDPVVLDPTALVPLTLSDDPDGKLSRYACASFWGPGEHPDWALLPAEEICGRPDCKSCVLGYNCPPDVPPPGQEVCCNADQTAYFYKTCWDEPTLCNTTFCHYGHGARSPKDPIPDYWPTCTCTLPDCTCPL